MFNRIKNFFWGSNDDEQEQGQGDQGTSFGGYAKGQGPGWARAAAAAVEQRTEPVLREASASGAMTGGVQGLGWYAASQVQDHHGDFANEFLHEDQAGTAGTGRPGAAASAHAAAAGGSGRTGGGGSGGGRAAAAANSARERAAAAAMARAARASGKEGAEQLPAAPGSRPGPPLPLAVKAVEGGRVVLGSP
ncbi:hypothetical protein HYH03_004508 [Edaphochlamys debaryana]|uniref:Uncharacterized protein n=1 Tax=Edaphochlamys debaryana TaxID=47281 RepID=A0A835Y999_9CHLO|nr:hypothetical protein HYH03_004508 [Edaphochlamys debaryana]|eukprot:KAG2497347.1 hypothetical protein HYH03_004508 [Edaphochlamys debaryana]